MRARAGRARARGQREAAAAAWRGSSRLARGLRALTRARAPRPSRAGDIVAHATIAAAAAGASPAAREHVCAPLRARGGEAAPEGEPAAEPMIVQVSSSCTYPLTFSSMFNAGVVWCTAHRRPFTLAWGRPRAMSPAQVYDRRSVEGYMYAAAAKCNILAWVLNLLGGRKRLRIARTIKAGLSTFKTINAPKYDLQLFFNAGSLQRLEECLAPEEQPAFRVVWRSPRAAAKGGAARPLIVAAAAGSDDEAASSGASTPDRAAAAANAGAGKGPLPVPAAMLAPCEFYALPPAAGSKYGYALPPEMLIGPNDSVEVRRAKIAAAVATSKAGGWQLFMHNMVTYLWRQIYGSDLPTAAALSPAAVRKLLPHLPESSTAIAGDLRHSFSVIGE